MARLTRQIAVVNDVTHITVDTVMPDLTKDLGVDLSSFFGRSSLSFVVADPNQPDCPIIFVNRAFEMTTGYSHRYVVGRNCRFLQGPDTDPKAVQAIRVALKRGEGVEQTLLNYRADGSPFHNELVVTAIHDASGKLAYFVGVQREIAAPGVAARGDESAGATPPSLDGRATLDIVRHQVQLHLSVVMEMSKHSESGSEPQIDFGALLRRLEVLDLLYDNLSPDAVLRERLDVGAYVSQIAAKLAAKSPRPGVHMNISTSSVFVPLDLAVRVGVVLAELVEASLTESLAGLDAGVLEVMLDVEDNTLVLSVYDDGSGDPSASEWLQSGALTPKVIRRLLDDINAEITAPPADHGREIVVRVPLGDTVAGA